MKVVVRIAAQKITVRTGPRANGATGARYVHVQANPSTQWPISHTLGQVSHCTFFDSTGQTFACAWFEVAPGQISHVPFISPLAGKVYIS